ncbi:MAG: hypothetical protein NT013_06925 [Planctomycetia bacterium]|nr:hypothetical protein [Planctomycetia bacterium]
MKPEPMQHAKALPNTTSPIVKWFDQHGNTATAIICVAMIGGAIWFSYYRTTSGRNEQAWARFSQARSAEDFAGIAEDFSSTDVGAWARLSEGERLLESGISLMFSDRAAGLGDLKKADEALRKVLSSSGALSVTRERAQWALAKSVETQSDADSTKAVAAYETFLKEFPKSTYKVTAEERIETLKSGRAKEFYAWFHKQKPKPADRAKPKDGLPSGHPPIGDTSKELPDDGENTTSTEKKSDAKTDDKPAEATSLDSVQDRLKKELEADFNRTPLQDAFKLIAEKCNVEINIDGDALKAAGFTKNMPQTLKLDNVTGLAAIKAILKKYEQERVPLVLVVDEEQKKALITTSEFAEKEKLTPFVFPKESEKPKDNAENPKEEADKPKAEDAPKETKEESKDAPAESK